MEGEGHLGSELFDEVDIEGHRILRDSNLSGMSGGFVYSSSVIQILFLGLVLAW